VIRNAYGLRALSSISAMLSTFAWADVSRVPVQVVSVTRVGLRPRPGGEPGGEAADLGHQNPAGSVTTAPVCEGSSRPFWTVTFLTTAVELRDFRFSARAST